MHGNECGRRHQRQRYPHQKQYIPHPPGWGGGINSQLGRMTEQIALGWIGLYTGCIGSQQCHNDVNMECGSSIQEPNRISAISVTILKLDNYTISLNH